MSGKGNKGENGGSTGDLIIKIKVKEDSFFQRKGYDIYTDIQIPLVNAVLGTNMQVKTLRGTYNVSIPPGTNHGTKIRLSG